MMGASQMKAVSETYMALAQLDVTSVFFVVTARRVVCVCEGN